MQLGAPCVNKNGRNIRTGALPRDLHLNSARKCRYSTNKDRIFLPSVLSSRGTCFQTRSANKYFTRHCTLLVGDAPCLVILAVFLFSPNGNGVNEKNQTLTEIRDESRKSAPNHSLSLRFTRFSFKGEIALRQCDSIASSAMTNTEKLALAE